MNTHDALGKTNAASLARLLNLKAADPLWSRDDLGAMLRHQLAAPVRFDLVQFDRTCSDTVTACSGLPNPISTFGELLHHPHPPVELLILTKQFAKAQQDSENQPLPQEIATVLYFGAIVVARMRCGQQISRLTDNELRRGIDWTVAQPWVDEATRELFREALAGM